MTAGWDGRNFGRAWHAIMVPAAVVHADVAAGRLAKSDQCELFHSTDTLADLEVQVLLNALCTGEDSRTGRRH